MVISRRVLKAGFWIVFGVILCAGMVVLRNILQMREDVRWLGHSRDVRDAIQMTLTDLVDAESGERGYLLSGDRPFLQTYEDGRARTQATSNICGTWLPTSQARCSAVTAWTTL